MKEEQRKKGEEQRRRFSALKDLMSTFAMSTVAVVAVVTLMPTSPKAEILKAIPLNEEISYQVNVTDEDNALDTSTLFVVLENQLEYYEQPISLGENSGYFHDLRTNTEYRLSVYGNKGFGQERLDTIKLTTKERIGGTILGVEKETIDYATTYRVDVLINDPEQIYTNIQLFYGYQWEEDAEFTYDSLPISENKTTIELTDIYTTYPVHIYLEATTIDGLKILDELWVTPPFTLYASVYMEYINRSQVGFHLYGDMDVGDTHYIMNIYNNDFLLRTDSVTLNDNSHYGNSFVIDQLQPNTSYTLECIASYTNPQTLAQETKVLYYEKITTLNDYSYTYIKDISTNNIDIFFSLYDPSDYFHYLYVEIYDTGEEFEMYLESESYDLFLDGEEKIASFMITIPSTSSYKIYISVQSQTIYNARELIDIIQSE